MVILSVSDVSLTFGHKTILDRVSFSLNEGDRLGIIGQNGAGKTTLFRLITGEYTPDSGNIFLSKGKTIGLLRQDVAVMCRGESTTLYEYVTAAFPELLALEAEIAEAEKALASSPAETVSAAAAHYDALERRFQDLGGLTFRSRCRGMLLHMGFSDAEIDRPVASLSGGQHTRLALSRLLCREPDVLLLDEPTNHLDIDALLWLEDFLSAYPKTLLLISHDRYFLDRVTTKTLKIFGQTARLYPGNYTKYKAQEELEVASREKQYKEQAKVIARIEKNIQFQRECGMEHNFVTIRAKEKQLERMEKVEKLPPPPKEMRLLFSAEEATANEVLTAKDVSFSYDKNAEKPLLSHLSFLLRKGERMVVMGRNGCGKSTLMKLCTGELSPTGGRLTAGYHVKIGYYDQENRFPDETRTVFGELRETYPNTGDFALRRTLALFLFGAEEIEKPISALSGGERARLTLAKLMLQKINLLIMDEPTNHLDITSREVLENAVLAFPGTVLAVSHDRYFVDRIATRILEIDPDAENGCQSYPVGEGESAYALYRQKKEEKDKEETVLRKAAGPSEEKRRYEKQKEDNRAIRGAERKKQRAKEKAALLEGELEALEKELFGSAATDYLRAAEIENRKAEIEEELLSLYELLL